MKRKDISSIFKENVLTTSFNLKVKNLNKMLN
jgi:hypothetical protein